MLDRRNPYARGITNVAIVRRAKARETTLAMPAMSFMEWARRVPEPKAGPLNFDRFPFQPELYEETGLEQEVVVKKSTQIGISALVIRWTMWVADVKGWTALYIFPNAKLMYDFADARVKPLIIGSEYLNGRVPRANTQNKGLRQIGSGFVYYRGSESTTGLESIDADAVALDEYDSLAAENIPVAERRLTGSEHGLIRRVGVPSTPDWGLDALYTESDQRRWHVKCDHDRKWQPVFFDEGAHPDGELSGFVDQEQMRVVCGRCRKPLDVANGEWVPAFPDRRVRGYHASRLIVPAVARNDRGMLGAIVKTSQSPEPFQQQVFHNRDLGEAFATKEGRLSLEVLRAAQRKELHLLTSYTGPQIVTAGIDVASVRALNVRISAHNGDGTKQALYIGKVENFDDIDGLIRAFRVQLFVVDHLPEGRLSRALCARFPGRGYLGVLAGPGPKKVLSVNEEEGSVTARRTEAIDAMMAMLRQQRNLLPWDLPEGYAKQLQAPVRFVDKDDVGREVVGYRSGGADDYAMAEVFDVIAADVWAYRQQLGTLQEGEITALEDRLEFQRAHLNDAESAGGYSPGMGETGYSAGFGAGDENDGFDSPYDAWDT